MTEIPERTIRSWLRELGDTPRQIYESLKERGVKGRRGNPRACPIANYLWSKVDPESCSVLVEGGWAVITGSEGPVTLMYSQPVWEFLERFDNGSFSELQEEEKSEEEE